jgi:hypothetical protein
MKSVRLLLLLLLSPFLITSGGCGDGRPSRVPASGQVLIDGQPLKFGSVRFIPADHRASRGVLDENGRFTLSCFEDRDGAVVGKHSVEIEGSEMVNPDLRRWHAPKKYQDRQTSGLTQDISGPTDQLIINLTWGGEKPFDEVYQSLESLNRKENAGAYK